MSFWTEKRLDGGVCILEFANEPNGAMPVTGMAELHKNVDSLAGDAEIKALVITGAQEGVFIAHADVGDLIKIGRREDAGADPASWYMATISLAAFPAPTIAAINGQAWGGGLEVALCTDIRFAARSASLGQPEIRVGLIPGAGGTQRLSKLVGKAKAAELIFEGRVIDAAEALSIGMVNRVYEDSTLMDATLEFALNLARYPTEALRSAKTAVNSSDVQIAEGLSLESRLFSKLLPSDEAQELLAAILAEGGKFGN